MARIVFVGMGAGVAAALLFASLISGAALSIILFYLAPLPIMIAALGWSHWAGLIAVVVGSAGLALTFGQYFCLAFVIGVALPAWWLGYLALLARPNATDSVEWYPAGALTLWSAILGTLIVVAIIPQFGLDQQSFQSGLRSALAHFLEVETPSTSSEGSGVDQSQIVDFLVLVVPPIAAFVSTLTLAFNLWCAGSIVRISGRLIRPWPDIPSMSLPMFAPALIAGSAAGSFLPGLAGVVSLILFASLLMAYAVLGFAVLHAITRSVSIRGFLLAATYAVVIVFGWPVLMMAALGLANTFFNIRSRVEARRRLRERNTETQKE
jgi:hypothetical protein